MRCAGHELAEKPDEHGAQGGLLKAFLSSTKKRRLSSNTGLVFAGSVLFLIGNVGPTLI